MNAADRAITDEERESRIEQLGAAMVLATDLTERARLWRRLKDEIAARSPAQVVKMEAQKGLR
ncbi:hypothetical protein FVF58_09380 [Paraburkholderia panacisoli]|uniref:Uncharacterized protein n=1 Tax=Paraburkholderia panacisoli TaxID=2603818 RepID=A0A5B0HDF0_9BURK|nr:hypothetical protein [Paraburkholderia panacisoli]KAA1012993.1 hypothetical protein FVF58_09380 [Paraburkholderia panacisoli]